MSKEFIFFCCACCILLLTTINLSVGYIIKYKPWGTLNCALYEDSYNDMKDGLPDDAKKMYDKLINECKNKKGFNDMEYTAFIFNIVIGLVCGILGLLHLFDVNKGFVSKTGLIGLICGIIGFIMTFVYIILNGIVFTTYTTFDLYEYVFENNYNPSYGSYKRDSDGAYAELDTSNNNGYKCTYFDEDDLYAIYPKFSDLNQKQYNYDKDYYFETRTEITECRQSIDCTNGYITGQKKDNSGNLCKKLYVPKTEDISNKDMFDRFFTTLFLSLFVCIANIGLVIFGFLLFKNSGN